MAEKQAVARRKRRVTVTLSSILAVALVAGLGWFLVSVISSGGDDSAAKKDERIEDGDGHPKDKVVMNALSLSKPASASKGAEKCEYKDVKPVEGQPENTELEDVGKPGDGKKPNTGTQKMSIDLKQGPVTAEIDNSKAPCTAASFTYLAKKDFFNKSECHRLTTKDLFVLQCGDPSGTGRGGPKYQYATEYVPKDTAKDLSKKEQKEGKKPKPNYKAGTLAMANSGEDTNGSQFFIVYEDTYLPPNYTILGKVTSGLDVVRDIAKKGAWITKKEQEERQQQQMGGMG
ncbi:peptidyl-prolyl cis-trans isomerase cyclophilin type [Stackebrandtia nassauensis DSM 44728]|uniref:Peptidyl-prolyl cis-trans isomerase n=2 Tax=Stackebrandtia TaxID=283810 RepID=D3PYP3_STANL|nr:peptidyl-prolyl cis-trans isomerase cyclophilin type [Stackebrandtia nassauensis DSM 44728]